MNKNLTELVFIIDKSGSMSGLESDTIGGFNSLIEKQRKEEECVLVTTVLFNHELKYIHDRVEIKDVKKMGKDDYVAEGCTALLDAVGDSVNHIMKRQSELKDECLPKKTLVVIITDGQENSSKNYNYEEIRKLVEKQKELGWEFIFLGANIDVYHEAYRIGFDQDKAVRYCCDSRGVDLNYEALYCAVSEIKNEGKLSNKWRKAIDKDYKSREKK